MRENEELRMIKRLSKEFKGMKERFKNQNPTLLVLFFEKMDGFPLYFSCQVIVCGTENKYPDFLFINMVHGFKHGFRRKIILFFLSVS